MLYLSTRNNKDAFTAQRVLRENRADDGGFYLPFRMPVFSTDEIDSLANIGFSACTAQILNRLFNTRLTGWDIDFAVGRYPVRLEKMSHHIIIGETWHNPEQDFAFMCRGLSGLLRCDDTEKSSTWSEIALRIAVLFGISGELMRGGIMSREYPVDVSVVSGDFSAPIAAWLARSWGLPIGNIICCCNENGSVWDLFHHGQLRTDGISTVTCTPEADYSVPPGLEILIYLCGGYAETQRYVEACAMGKTYCPSELMLAKLRKGMHVSVVSSQRLISAIPSVYRTHSYLMSPYTSLAYAGLQDYRVNMGESRYGLILADKSPVKDPETVANALGIPKDELSKLI